MRLITTHRLGALVAVAVVAVAFAGGIAYATGGGAAVPTNAKTWFTYASVGQTVTLYTVGPFTYTGQCDAGPYAETDVSTSQDNSMADSYEGTTQQPFGPGDGPIELGLSAPNDSNNWAGPNDGMDAQISGDGRTYVNTAVSDGVNIAGHDCVFAGTAFSSRFPSGLH